MTIGYADSSDDDESSVEEVQGTPPTILQPFIDPDEPEEEDGSEQLTPEWQKNLEEYRLQSCFPIVD